MFEAMVRIQWKACRHFVIIFMLAAFCLPIASVHLGWKGEATNLPQFLAELELWGWFYPVLAAATAISIAILTWRSDRRGRHIYAMTLPIDRSRYVWLRLAGGALLAGPVLLAAWLGALVSVWSITMPEGLRSFPIILGLKFGLALLLFLSLAFAVASASPRTLGWMYRGLALLVALHIGVALLWPSVNIALTILSALATAPGPFAALGGRWMLIDV